MRGSPTCGCSRNRPTRILVEQLKGRTDKTGQFVLPIGRQPTTIPTRCSSRRRRPRRRATSRPPSGSTGACMKLDPRRSGRRPSISATCCARWAARSRRRRPIAPPIKADPRLRRRPGTISPTCSTIRAAPTKAIALPRARARGRSATMPMRCSTSALLLQRLERHAEAAELLAALSRARPRFGLGGARQARAEDTARCRSRGRP